MSTDGNNLPVNPDTGTHVRVPEYCMNHPEGIARDLVYEAIDQINDLGLSSVILEKAPDARLSGNLDSLGVVNLVTCIEEISEQRLGVTISLADAASADSLGALETVGNLCGTVARLLEARSAQ